MGEVGELAIHPEDLDRSKRGMGASFTSGEPFEEEMRFRRKDEEYRWFLARAVPLRDKRGKVVKWYGAATDIQDRKRAEELQADLAHTNRVSMLGELAASISHELKQPIAAAMANAQASLRWLKREQPDLDQACRSTEAIVKDERLAADIIDRLRSLYKNDSSAARIGRRMRNHRRNDRASTERSKRACCFDSDGPCRRSPQDHRRPGATAAGTDEPHAQWYRGDEGDRRSAHGQDGTG